MDHPSPLLLWPGMHQSKHRSALSPTYCHYSTTDNSLVHACIYSNASPNVQYRKSTERRLSPTSPAKQVQTGCSSFPMHTTQVSLDSTHGNWRTEMHKHLILQLLQRSIFSRHRCLPCYGSSCSNQELTNGCQEEAHTRHHVLPRYLDYWRYYRSSNHKRHGNQQCLGLHLVSLFSRLPKHPPSFDRLTKPHEQVLGTHSSLLNPRILSRNRLRLRTRHGALSQELDRQLRIPISSQTHRQLSIRSSVYIWEIA